MRLFITRIIFILKMSKTSSRIILLLFIVFNGIPMIVLFMASLLPNEITSKGIGTGILCGVFNEITFNNYLSAFNKDNQYIIYALIRTLLLSVFTVFLVFVLSNSVGYILSRYRFRYRESLSH